MKTFYEYLEQQNFHETELSANASNANALLGLNGGQKEFKPSPTYQTALEEPEEQAKILVDKLKRKYASEFDMNVFIIKSIKWEASAFQSLLYFKGIAEQRQDFPPMGKPEDILKHGIRDLISSEGKITNFRITLSDKKEKYVKKGDPLGIAVLTKAQQYAQKTGGELEIKQDPLGTFYFINYKNGNRINYLTHGQIGAMTRGDIKSHFGNVQILEKSGAETFQFAGTATVL
jgi:hypothetical protein